MAYCMRWLLWCFCLLAESYEAINHWPLTTTLVYMYWIFSVPVGSILPICHKRLNESLQLNAFAIDYCDLKIKVCYSCLQHYGTAQAMRLNCSNLKISPDCIVMNGIKKYCYITLPSSINCVTFLVQSNLSISSIYSIRYFFVGPDRIPIFCVHFCSSIYSFRHLFLALRRVLFG